VPPRSIQKSHFPAAAGILLIHHVFERMFC